MSGVYVHIPFCSKKCIYCNFYSIATKNLNTDYIQALTKEISLRRNYLDNTEIKTLYFGGGTPTLLNLSELESIISHLHQNFNLKNLVEITIEANPEQLTSEYAKGLKKLGFNRISIGIQSFDDSILQLLGRTHNKTQAESAITNAYNAGFDNISIDLIYGITARKKEGWLKELNHLKKFPVCHFSAYALTVEENTLLYKKIANRQIPSTDDERYIKEINELMDFAEENDFLHYEISNFAKNGFQSIHNSNYWNRTPYMGIGASAHSYNGTSRQWNAADIKRYIDKLSRNILPCEVELLSPNDIFNEYILLHLRTRKGINLTELQDQFGKEKIKHFYHELTKINNDYYILQNNILRLTRKGIMLTDDITATLFL